MNPYQAPLSDDLLVAYLLGEATADERQAIEAAAAASEDVRMRLEQFRRLLEASRTVQQDVPPVDVNAAWERFEERVASGRAPRRRFGWLRVAALVAVFAGLALLARTLLADREGQPVLVAAQDAPLRDTLPDGSVITLNRGSSLTYQERFTGDSRPVALKGEAFFSVTPDKKKPFVITVNDVTVTVVGTSFNIRSKGGRTEVIVETGIVRVRQGAREVTLRPAERVLVQPGDTVLNVATANDKLYAYYRSGEFVCDNTPLWRLVEVLNEAYGSSIVIDRPELRNLPLTTTFRNESVDAVLEVVAATFNLQVQRGGSIIHLR
ncbi:MAG: DUF4974 domain-containing protein [Chitinophagaceae bacterium]|nr:MAG: DUF4974 domain-containing protein [Chitinophagaceae bacterium]